MNASASRTVLAALIFLLSPFTLASDLPLSCENEATTSVQEVVPLEYRTYQTATLKSPVVIYQQTGTITYKVEATIKDRNFVFDLTYMTDGCVLTQFDVVEQ